VMTIITICNQNLSRKKAFCWWNLLFDENSTWHLWLIVRALLSRKQSRFWCCPPY
jgi:hypothetical protein